MELAMRGTAVTETLPLDRGLQVKIKDLNQDLGQMNPVGRGSRVESNGPSLKTRGQILLF